MISRQKSDLRSKDEDEMPNVVNDQGFLPDGTYAGREYAGRALTGHTADSDGIAHDVYTAPGQWAAEMDMALRFMGDLEAAGRAEVKAKRKANRKAKRRAFYWRAIESFANTSPYAVPYVPFDDQR